MDREKTRELQLKILDIVKYIDNFCKKNKIEYYLIYGSCLGAVRHNGFIPWDDDFDIGMTYDNYLKFIKACELKLDKKKYFLQTMETDPNYYLQFAKIRDINTILKEKYSQNINMQHGVYIDIFPIVGIPNNKFKKKVWEICRAFTLSANVNVINNTFLYSIFKIIKLIVGKKNIIKICTKTCVKYNCQEFDNWCSVFDGDGVKMNSTTKKIMGKPRYVQFENLKLPIPFDYDSYLKNTYGDYMKIPSKEQIEKKYHEIVELNLHSSK